MAFRMSQMLHSSKEIRSLNTAPLPPAVAKQSPAATTRTTLDQEEERGHSALEPLFEEADETPFEEPLQTEEDDDRVRAEQVYEELVAAAVGIFAAAKTRLTPDGPAIVEAVRAALEELARGDYLRSVTVPRRSQANTLALRSANVAVLAMRVGLELDYDKKRGSALGLCGLMHDVGMLTIPDKVLGSGQLSAKQVELLHRHPGESQKIVTSFGEAFGWIGKIVVQVHERRDGSGYPARLRGENIHQFARIIGLVDTYEAMAQPRADRKARVIYDALKQIIDLRNSQFDRPLIKALINVIFIFPLGSLVKLNNGEIGRVVATSKSHPTKPGVDILLDGRGERLAEPRHIILEEEPMVYIVDPGIEEGVLEEARG
jgi:HD-GYP domain-containing protein (c-di-GMP phosphodiesterase class II)